LVAAVNRTGHVSKPCLGTELRQLILAPSQ
jgi:hypothetical protein